MADAQTSNERDAFEAWAKDLNMLVLRKWSSDATQAAWQAWQAANAAHEMPQPAMSDDVVCTAFAKPGGTNWPARVSGFVGFLVLSLALGELSSWATHQPRWAWWWNPVQMMSFVLSCLSFCLALGSFAGSTTVRLKSSGV